MTYLSENILRSLENTKRFEGNFKFLYEVAIEVGNLKVEDNQAKCIKNNTSTVFIFNDYSMLYLDVENEKAMSILLLEQEK